MNKCWKLVHRGLLLGSLSGIELMACGTYFESPYDDNIKAR